MAPSPTGPSGLAWTNLSPRAVPDLLHARELGPVLWQILILDGVARRVRGDVAIPADRPETAEVRAVATQALVPARGVVGRAAAVWVHTGGPSPERIDVLVPPRARRPDPHPQRLPHECALPAADVVAVGAVRVTTVARTAVDVARWSSPGDARPLLARLVRSAGLDPERALCLLDGLAGHRGTRHARDTLAEAARAAAAGAAGGSSDR